jgi:hypothetical protein
MLPFLEGGQGVNCSLAIWVFYPPSELLADLAHHPSISAAKIDFEGMVSRRITYLTLLNIWNWLRFLWFVRFHEKAPQVKPFLATCAEIQCMFWCMFASDVTAIYCDILQNRNGAQVFYSV